MGIHISTDELNRILYEVDIRGITGIDRFAGVREYLSDAKAIYTILQKMNELSKETVMRILREYYKNSKDGSDRSNKIRYKTLAIQITEGADRVRICPVCKKHIFRYYVDGLDYQICNVCNFWYFRYKDLHRNESDVEEFGVTATDRSVNQAQLEYKLLCNDKTRVKAKEISERCVIRLNELHWAGYDIFELLTKDKGLNFESDMYYVENEYKDRTTIVTDYVWEMSQLYIKDKYGDMNDYYIQTKAEKLYLDVLTSEE